MKKAVIFLLAVFYLFASIFSASPILDLEDYGKPSKQPVYSPGSSSTGSSSTVRASVCYDSDSTDSDTSDEEESEEINAFEVLEIFNDRIIALSQNVRAALTQRLFLDGNVIYKECNFTECTLNALYRDLESQPLEREWVADFKSAFNHIHRILKFPQLMRERYVLCESCKENEAGKVCINCKKFNEEAAYRAYKMSKALVYWQANLTTVFGNITKQYYQNKSLKKKKSCFGRLL